jgi:hypothetical protein
VVTPTGKRTPLAGKHETVVGGVPPVAEAGPYVAFAGCPDGESSVTGAGQIALGDTNNCVGCPGLPPHPGSTKRPEARPARAIRILRREREEKRTGALTHYDPFAKRVKVATSRSDRGSVQLIAVWPASPAVPPRRYRRGHPGSTMSRTGHSTVRAPTSRRQPACCDNHPHTQIGRPFRRRRADAP